MSSAMKSPTDFDAAEKYLERSPRVYGLLRAVVLKNEGDPDRLGRIQVGFVNAPKEAGASTWAGLATPMAGKKAGFCVIPDIEDEVLVAFEQGDVDKPFITGSIWNGERQPPYSNEDKKNNVRQFTSRSGHTVTLDDTDKQERIVIQDKTKKNTIIFDSKNNTITITADQTVSISSNGGVQIDTKGDIKMSCRSFNVEAKSAVSIKADVSFDLKCMPGGVKLNTDGLVVK